MSQNSGTMGTSADQYVRWFAANSTNTTAFAVLAVLTGTTLPNINGTGWIMTTSPRGTADPGTGTAPQIPDGTFGAYLARNICSMRFLGVDAGAAGTFNFRVSGGSFGNWKGAAGTSQPKLMVAPTPLVMGTATLGTKATGTGVTNEKYADTITINTTTQQGSRIRVWSGGTATALLANDIATLEVDFSGFQMLLLETDIATGPSSCNAEYRFF